MTAPLSFQEVIMDFLAGFLMGAFTLIVIEVVSGPEYLRQMADHIEDNRKLRK